MALRAYRCEDLERWRNLLMAAARDIQKVRAQLDLSDLSTVELSATRAIRSMEFIREWAASAEREVRSQKLDAMLSISSPHMVDNAM